MELKLNSTLKKAIYNASKYIDKSNERFADVRLRSNGSELYVYSTNGSILYTAGYGVSTEPLDVAIRGVDIYTRTDAMKQVDSLQVDPAYAFFRYKDKPVFSAKVVHNPVKRIDFERFFSESGIASFYTTKSDIDKALHNYKHLLAKRSKDDSVPLYMHITDEGVKLASSGGVTAKLNATDITGEHSVKFDALKLRSILPALYDDVYIELFMPGDITYIRIMSEEVWFVLAPMATYDE